MLGVIMAEYVCISMYMSTRVSASVSSGLFWFSGRAGESFANFELQELPQSDRARLLSQLAAKVFSHAVGS